MSESDIQNACYENEINGKPLPWAEVTHLILNKAVHRSGFCLADATPLIAATHHVMEAGELLNEIVFRPNDGEKILYEIADCMGCLIHLAILLGYGRRDVESAIVEKLRMRFNIPSETVT